MTREEAIQRLKANRDAMYFPETVKALDMAIEALSVDAVEVKAEQLPPKVPPEWINEGMVLVPQHDWIEMQKKLEEYVSAEAEEAVLNKMLKEEMIILPQDYIKVVRCKDCRYATINKHDRPLCTCVDRTVRLNDYCSYGERDTTA